MFELSMAKLALEPDELSPVITLKVVSDDGCLVIKKAIDALVALFGLALLSPLMIAITIAIRAKGPGPVLFVQERFGFRKRVFRMYKFRTMVPGEERLQASLEHQNQVADPVFKMKNHLRMTPLGRFLRKTSLDELPQLLNVLKGEMSVVGPRPLPIRDVSRFDDASLMRQFSVKPGTCLWNVQRRSNTGFDRWIESVSRYIDNCSLTLDVEILAKTVPTVLAGKGAV